MDFLRNQHVISKRSHVKTPSGNYNVLEDWAHVTDRIYISTLEVWMEQLI